MTFKYLYVLKVYSVDEESVNSISFELKDCDCPLDSIILSKLENYKNEKWTCITRDKYYEIQDTIQNKIQDTIQKSRLLFDFEFYQDLNFSEKQ